MNLHERPDTLRIGYIARPAGQGDAAERALRDLAEVMDVELLRIIVKPEDYKLPLNQRFGLLEAIRAVQSCEAMTLITDNASLEPADHDDIATLYAKLAAVDGDLVIVDLRLISVPAQRDGLAGERLAS